MSEGYEIVSNDEPSIEDYPVTTDRDPGDEDPEWASEEEYREAIGDGLINDTPEARRDAAWGVR